MSGIIESLKAVEDFTFSFLGFFACCNQKTPLFNPLSTNATHAVAGCCNRDHVIDSTTRELHPNLVHDLLKMRDEVCVPYTKPKASENKTLVSIFSLRHVDLFNFIVVLIGFERVCERKNVVAERRESV